MYVCMYVVLRILAEKEDPPVHKPSFKSERHDIDV